MRFSIGILNAAMCLGGAAFCAEPLVQSAPEPLADASRPLGLDASRSLFDSLIVATVNRDAPAASQAKARLVLEHPQSIYARYVVTSFAQPADYRKLLRDQLKEHQEELGAGFANAFCQAVHLGLAWFGPQFLADDAFLLECALAGYEARDYRLKTTCLDKLRQSEKEPTRQIASIAFSDWSTNVEKVLRLHEIDEQPAPLFEQHFASRLSGAERELPEMLRVAAETLLEDGKFADALPLVEKLVGCEQTPQVLYWRAWCLAATGRTEDAITAIATLQQLAPGDPWAASAVEIGASLHSLEANFAAMADLLLAAAERIRREDNEGVEGTISYRTKDGHTISVYVGVMFGQGAFEAVVHEDGQIVLAYKAAQGQTHAYAGGEPTIQAFRQSATYPVFSCAVDVQDDNLSYHWNVNMSKSAEAISQIRERIKISPTLLTREGLEKVLRRTLQVRGILPAALVRDASGTCLTLLHPQARKPELERSVFRFAPDAALTHVQVGRFACENLRYGPSDAIDLSPPRWPELAVVDREAMDAASTFRMVAAAISLFDSKSASTPAPERR